MPDKITLPSVGLCFKHFKLGSITTDFLLEEQLDFQLHNSEHLASLNFYPTQKYI